MYPDCCGATDPLPVLACPGEPASFSTTPTGTPPFTYQWKKDGTPIAGATASSYSIAAVTPGDAGDYSVVVSGSCGTVAALFIRSSHPPCRASAPFPMAMVPRFASGRPMPARSW